MAGKKKFLLIVLKWIVISSSLFYVAYRIYDSSDVLGNYSLSFFDLSDFLFLIVALGLVFINWLLEAIKWRELLAVYTQISLWDSYRGVLIGLSAAIYTPNRVGEYFGRVLVLKKDFISQGVLATITGSLAQVLITLIPGAVAFGLLFVFFPDMSEKTNLDLWVVLVVSGFFALILLVLYLNMHKFGKFLFRLPIFRKFREYSDKIQAFRLRTLSFVLLLSGLRYVVFVSQYLLLLIVFKVDILYFQALIAISAGYFVMLIIPVFTFAEAGLRGAVALFFMEMVSDSTLGILSSAIGLWIINLALPALLGTLLISKIKVKIA